MSQSLTIARPPAGDAAQTALLIVGLAALAGWASAALATAVSFLAGTGQTPAILFGRSAHFSTLLRWQGLPFEFFGLVWFMAVLWACRAARKRPENVFWTGLFVSAVPITGFGIWMTTAARGLSWSSIVSTGASGVILIVAALIAPVGAAQLVRSVGTLVRSPVARIPILGAVLLVVVSGEILRIPIQGISSTDAQARSFRRWYAGQPHPARPDLTTAGSVKVVVFTDYKCPFCASSLPLIEAAISRFRANGTSPVEFVIRDYPLEPTCNPAITKVVHPGACLVAAAVRFVRQERGDTVGHEFASWCYRSVNNGLSDGAVWDRLRQLDMADGFQQHYDAVMALVRADAVFGQSVGVRGPSLPR